VFSMNYESHLRRPAARFLSKFFSEFLQCRHLEGKRVSKQLFQFSWNVAAGASPKAPSCVSAWLTDFRKDLARIDVPTLIIQGDADRILRIDATGRRLHEAIKGSRSRREEYKGRTDAHNLDTTHEDDTEP